MAQPLPRPLRAYLTAEAQTTAELRQVLADAAEEAERLIPKLMEQGGVGGRIRAAQLSLVLREIRALMAALFGDVGRTIQEGRLDAAAAAARGEDILLDYLRESGLGREAEQLLESFVTQAKQGFATIKAKAQNGIPLSSQVYRTQALATGYVNRVVTRGMLLGHGAKEIARDVRDLIRPDVRGGVSYAAMRLARTELNNAFRTAQEQRYAGEPWTRGMRWNLSGSHPAPDICNVNAEQDVHGLGVGVYPVGERPDSHPNCLCYLTPEQIEEEDFVEGFLAGAYDDYLDSVDGGTPAREGLATVIPINRRQERATSTAPPAPAVVGRNVTADVERQTKDGNSDNPFMTAGGDFSDPRDHALAAVAEMQGFNGLPGKGSVDDEIARGGVELWRGVVPFKGKDDVPARTSEELVDLFESGEYEPGTGVYGNGFYWSVARRVAEHFSTGGDLVKKRVKGGAVQRSALRADARVVDYDELLEMQRSFKEENADKVFSIFELYAANFVTPEDKLSPHFMDYYVNEPGRFAAMLGYDAIRVVGKPDGAPAVKGEPSAKTRESTKRFSANDQYIILNRTAVVVEA